MLMSKGMLAKKQILPLIIVLHNRKGLDRFPAPPLDGGSMIPTLLSISKLRHILPRPLLIFVSKNSFYL